LSNTAISCWALESGWKNPMGGVAAPIGSLVVCQIFHGNRAVMSSPTGSRSELIHTCGPEATAMLFASERAAALHMSSLSRITSYSALPQKAPGTRS
jgi:hypothetical protein